MEVFGGENGGFWGSSFSGEKGSENEVVKERGLINFFKKKWI